MQMLGFLFFMLWIVALLVGIRAVISTDSQRGEALAGNWVIYRNAVIHYAMQTSGGFSASINDASLSLPPGYRNLGGWTNTVAGRTLYIYGNAGAFAAPQAVEYAEGSYAVGFVQGGNWVSPQGGVIAPAPAFVPNGDLLTVVVVN